MSENHDNKLGTRTLLWLILFGGIVGAALWYSIPAHAAPSEDQRFYNLLTGQGITPGPLAVSIAHRLCASVWAGVSPWTWVSAVYYQNAAATWDDARNFVADAVVVYCDPGTQQSAPSQTGFVA